MIDQCGPQHCIGEGQENNTYAKPGSAWPRLVKPVSECYECAGPIGLHSVALTIIAAPDEFSKDRETA